MRNREEKWQKYLQDKLKMWDEQDMIKFSTKIHPLGCQSLGVHNCNNNEITK